jgi:mannose-6-phosphate isomerase-like protein (cupin superfamily)
MKYMHLINENDLEEIFSSSWLYGNNSFYVIDKITKTHRTDIQFSSHLEYSKYIKNSYDSGNTIIVKNLESFHPKIRAAALKYGMLVDVHMYLVPPKGTDSFDYHKDDCDVTIVMVYGSKRFYIKESGEEKVFNLNEGDSLFIKKEFEHRALPTGPSCLLSFGIKEVWNYYVPGGLEKSNFQTSAKDL